MVVAGTVVVVAGTVVVVAGVMVVGTLVASASLASSLHDTVRRAIRISTIRAGKRRMTNTSKSSRPPTRGCLPLQLLSVQDGSFPH